MYMYLSLSHSRVFVRPRHPLTPPRTPPPPVTLSSLACTCAYIAAVYLYALATANDELAQFSLLLLHMEIQATQVQGLALALT